MQGPAERETPAHGRGPGYEAMPLDEHAVEVLSHELRSPITTIHLGAKVLRTTDVRPPVRDAVLEAVDLEADRLLRVVEDLLAVVRHGTGQRLRLEPLLVQRRLGDLLGETRTEPGARVRSFLPQDLPAVMADDAALGQVVRNLVINAENHGSSRFPTEIVGRAEPPDWVTLQVLDRGQGIDPVDAERIFEPFYRSPTTSCSGAGLGLAAAQRLMTAMGGSLTVAPRAGGGTAFTIRLRIAGPGD